jgi:hypothetical protein
VSNVVIHQSGFLVYQVKSTVSIGSTETSLCYHQP